MADSIGTINTNLWGRGQKACRKIGRLAIMGLFGNVHHPEMQGSQEQTLARRGQMIRSVELHFPIMFSGG